MLRPLNCYLVVALLCIPCGIATAADQEMVVVHLASGRTFTAWLDERTDEGTLWLRFQSAGMTIHRPIDWDRVTSAEYRGQSLSGIELQQLAQTIKTKAEDIPAASIGPEPIDVEGTNSYEVVPIEPPLLETPVESIRGLTIDAELGNWDQDDEPDGIVLWLAPEDRYGRLIEVSGHVDVRLLAPLTRQFDEAPTSNGSSLEPIASWTSALSPADFDSNGARLLLPFQAFDPDRDDRVGNFGLVRVKLVVPGQGVYERVLHLVRLRPFSPLRDRYGVIE